MAITLLKKGLLGKKDFSFDLAGTGVQFAKERSDGRTNNDFSINAGHFPLISGTRGKTRIGAATSLVTDVDAAIAELYDDMILALPLAGGTLTGDVNFGDNDITSLDLLSFKVAGTGIDLNNSPIVDCKKLTIEATATTGIDMATSKLVGLSNATVTGDALHFCQVDDSTLEVTGAGVLQIKDDGVKVAKLDMDTDGTAPTHFLIAAGNSAGHAGGGTAFDITVTLPGILVLTDNDVYSGVFQVNGAATKRIETIKRQTNTVIRAVTSAVIVAGDIIAYQVWRATA